MTAAAQTKYQVRFAFGVEAGRAIVEGAHVVVWADALPGTTDPAGLAAAGALVTGSTGSRTALAAWILERQADLGDRAIVAVVAAGGPSGEFAVEDLLAAGAVIDALGDVGIDFTSPEAAAAAGAFAFLKNASAHILSASVAGQEAGPEVVSTAKAAAASEEFTILQEFPARA